MDTPSTSSTPSSSLLEASYIPLISPDLNQLDEWKHMSWLDKMQQRAAEQHRARLLLRRAHTNNQKSLRKKLATIDRRLNEWTEADSAPPKPKKIKTSASASASASGKTVGVDKQEEQPEEQGVSMSEVGDTAVPSTDKAGASDAQTVAGVTSTSTEGNMADQQAKDDYEILASKILHDETLDKDSSPSDTPERSTPSAAHRAQPCAVPSRRFAPLRPSSSRTTSTLSFSAHSTPLDPVRTSTTLNLTSLVPLGSLLTPLASPETPTQRFVGDRSGAQDVDSGEMEIAGDDW